MWCRKFNKIDIVKDNFGQNCKLDVHRDDIWLQKSFNTGVTQDRNGYVQHEKGGFLKSHMLQKGMHLLGECLWYGI